MFRKLGEFTTGHARWIVAAWLVAVLGMAFLAPKLSEVGVLEEAQFLPQGAESIKVRELVKEKFPAEAAPGIGALVFSNPDGLTEADMEYTQRVEAWLLSEEAPDVVGSVISVFDKPELMEMLISPDGTTMLMNINFSSPAFEASVNKAVGEIRDHLASAPPGLEAHLTGEAGIGSDLLDSVMESTHRATIITVILVIVLLLIIYRSPVASLVPLLTITAAFLVSRGVLGFLAAGGVKIPSQLDAFLIVLIFGVGTDYCLFIVSRFREEVARLGGIKEATVETSKRIGPVIAASAATVIIGFLCLAAARFGMIKTMGPCLGLTVFITLVAGLTLTPALMFLFGHRLFWPVKAAHSIGLMKGLGKFGKMVVVRPKTVILIVAILLLIPYLAVPHLSRSFDILGEMPEDKDSAQGFLLIESHFEKGQMMPLTVLLCSEKGDMMNPGSLSALQKTTSVLEEVEGVEVVKSAVHIPSMPEVTEGLKVKNQLAMIAAQIRQVVGGLSNPETLMSLSPDDFSAMANYLGELGQVYPEVNENENYTAVLGKLQELNSAFSRITPELVGMLGNLMEGVAADLENLGQSFGEDDFLISQSLLAGNSQVEGFLNLFFSEDKTTTRIQVLLASDPYSNEAMQTVTRVRHTLASNLDSIAVESYVGGPTAELADIRHITDADFNRIILIVIAGVLLVTMILLRAVVAPIYMVLSTILGFGTTLGVCTWLFQDLLNQGGVNYVVPIIIFVLLIAIGADYNIFLMSRVREESVGRDVRSGVRQAVPRVRGVIIACGIILAGTFAALTSAPLQSLFQIGAAIAIGVLINTFIIMTFLVPSLAAAVGKWSWWPGRVSR